MSRRPGEAPPRPAPGGLVLTGGPRRGPMNPMRRLRRSHAAQLALVALAATLPAPCPCPETPAAPPSGHECCAPPAGVRAADHDCCDAHSVDVGLLTPGTPAVPSPSAAVLPATSAIAHPGAGVRRPVVLAPSPPPSILRL